MFQLLLHPAEKKESLPTLGSVNRFFFWSMLGFGGTAGTQKNPVRSQDA
jgi:hypothetical protein